MSHMLLPSAETTKGLQVFILNYKTTVKVANTLVSLDYCNSLLYHTKRHILSKYNLLTYKAINFSQPPYLASLIKQSDLTRGNHLSISSSKPIKCSGLPSFTVAAPKDPSSH